MNRQLLLDVLPAPAPSLNNFIAGPNGEALAAARALAAGRAIYLWGPAGCGRSHLLRGLASRAGAVYIDAPSGPQMLRQLAQADSTAPMPAIIAVDDVHLMDKARQAALFALYNRWRESAATDRAFALAVAGDRAPMSLPLREDLRTRLGWDLVFRLEPLSDADKLSALSAQAADRGLQLAPEVINWMLTHHERDIRKLAALLDALDRYSLATGRPTPRAPFAIDQHQARAARAGVLIGGLYQLAARGMGGAGPGALGVLLGRAHIKDIGRAAGFGLPAAQGLGRDGADAMTPRQGLGALARAGPLFGRGAQAVPAGLAVIQAVILQIPAWVPFSSV